MNAPRPSPFARINLVTAAIVLSLATSIALIGLFFHALRWSPLEEASMQGHKLTPSDHIVSISFLDPERIVCDGAELTFEQLVHRVREERWNEHTLVHIAFTPKMNGPSFKPVFEVIEELRKQGIFRIQLSTHPPGRPSAPVIESAPAPQR